MKENTKEKMLVNVNEKSIFYKIKSFLKNLFVKNADIVIGSYVTATDENNIINETENNRNSFVESIRNIEDEETKLLKLQKQYRSSEVKEEDLTEEQKGSLCSLYDKQIANLRKSNEIRKQRLLEYRRKLQEE